jgi:hypothetical protein
MGGMKLKCKVFQLSRLANHVWDLGEAKMAKIKSPRRIIVIAVIVAVAVVVSSLGSVAVGGAYLAYQGRRLRTRLLCKTDHQALLEACRSLSNQAMTGELELGSYRVRGRPDREIAGLPEVIRTLQPAVVAIDRADGHVKIEMSGGWDSFGVYAYPKNFQKRFPFEYRDRELLEGLWYYDDFYKYPGRDAYDREIEALLTKCGKLKKQEGELTRPTAIPGTP